MDVITLKRLAFCEAAGRLQPEQILGIIPITYPILTINDILDKDLFPRVGLFDVDQALMASKSDAEQRPYFTVDNWAVLCKRIAAGG